MKLDLNDTTAGDVNKALLHARRASGTPAVGMVLTMVVVIDEEFAYDAMRAAQQASQEHPSRTVVVIRRHPRSPRDRTHSRLDAEVRLAADAGPGETVVLRLYGEVRDHAQSVVLPLLLPDAPVVVWWPVEAPDNPAQDPLGALAQRRITDMDACPDPLAELEKRADSYAPGDTDLAWTRLTLWRSALAAALDQEKAPVRSVAVEAEPGNPSAELLVRWLRARLQVPGEIRPSSGPAITGVRLETDRGELSVVREDGPLAALTLPGQPPRSLALKIRPTSELIAEELRRLDADEMYAIALRGGAGAGEAAASASVSDVV
jgi:glucose-6-phosphate dehydrogenase assembly protein OpcA